MSDPLANALVRIKRLEDERLEMDLQIDNLQESVGKMHAMLTLLTSAVDEINFSLGR